MRHRLFSRGTLDEVRDDLMYEAVLTSAGVPERLQAALTSGDLFRLLGVAAVIGTAEEASLSSAVPSAVISYGLWRR